MHSSFSQKISDSSSDKIYNNSHSRAGAAVIFNQMFFKGQTTRYGTDNDAMRLGNILADIGFDVKICNDLTVRDIKKELYDRKFAAKTIFCKSQKNFF